MKRKEIVEYGECVLTVAIIWSVLFLGIEQSLVLIGILSLFFYSIELSEVFNVV